MRRQLKLVLAAVGLAAAPITYLAGPAAAAPSPTCNGLPATIVGTGWETLVGTPGDDVIVGSNQGQTIYARGGNDTICGNGGRDIIYGQTGNDWINGGTGKDVLLGAAGMDTLIGGQASDLLLGGGHADLLNALGGSDIVMGEGGNDRAISRDGQADVIDLGPGNNDRAQYDIGLDGLLEVEIATPVPTAPLRGNMDLDFNLGVAIPGGAGEVPGVSWVGTVDFGGGRIYPIAFFPQSPVWTSGQWARLDEVWVLYDSLDVAFTDGIVTTFVPGAIVLAATDDAVGIPGEFFLAPGAISSVNPAADPHGLLDDSMIGRLAYWSGVYLGSPVDFGGPFMIFPA